MKTLPVVAMVTWYRPKNPRTVHHKAEAQSIIRFLKYSDEFIPDALVPVGTQRIKVVDRNSALQAIEAMFRSRLQRIVSALGIAGLHQSTLVPVPSSKTTAATCVRPEHKSVWPSALLCNRLVGAGFGTVIQPLVVFKSEQASISKMPSNGRPTTQARFETLATLSQPRVSPEPRYPVILVDDVVTWGSTTAAVAHLLESKGIPVNGAIVVGTTDSEPTTDALAMRVRTLKYDPSTPPDWRLSIDGKARSK